MQEPGAPNLKIVELVEAFDATGMTDAARAEIGRLHAQLSEELQRGLDPDIEGLFAGRRATPKAVLAGLLRLLNADPRTSVRAVGGLRATVPTVVRKLDAHHFKVLAAVEAATRGTEAYRVAEAGEFRTRKLLSACRDVGHWISSPSGKLFPSPKCLLTGEWGTGKTHALCDLALGRIASGRPTILFLAQGLGRGHPISALCRATKLATRRKSLLRALDKLGRAIGERALIIIDAINESDRQEWRRYLMAMLSELDAFPNVGLVLSCRTPYEDWILGRSRPRALVMMEHPAFGAIETEAQLSYFAFYGIPAPAYPLLVPEFTRPLFLKLLCESIESMSRDRKELFLGRVVTGHLGMTTILERVVVRLGARIERHHGLPSKTCWYILKGKKIGADGALVGIAPRLAALGRPFLPWPEAVAAVGGNIPGHQDSRRAGAVLRMMIGDGLLVEVPNWVQPDGPTYIGFPYQRFGEHLIARHLLRDLKTSSLEAVRQSLSAETPLGKALQVAPGGWRFMNDGVASALMVEFPNRVKRVPGIGHRELATFLPIDKASEHAVNEAFLAGLPWREEDSLEEPASEIIDRVLRGGTRGEVHALLDALIGFGCRPSHPFGARALWGLIASLSMPGRDLWWSEYLRECSSGATVFRLLSWCESDAAKQIDQEWALSCMRTLALFLTSTMREFRDRVTRALVLLGEKQPRALFGVTLRGLKFNDWYVPERLIAASYGVCMRGWMLRDAVDLREALPRFAIALIDRTMQPRAPHQTRHALSRDAILGIVALAIRVEPGAVDPKKLRRLRRPFAYLKTPFRPVGAITDGECEKVEDALQSDFANYIVGRLVEDRQNYDDKNPRYQAILRQIMGRMADLGYDKAIFGEIDRQIGREAWRPRLRDGKADRYGKKYSWIAYYEMYGVLQDAGQLDWDEPSIERTPHCDMDPSLPDRGAVWQPELGDPFVGQPTRVSEWIQHGPKVFCEELFRRDEVDSIEGPWELLDGFVLQRTEAEPRQVITSIRTVLAGKATAARLRVLGNRGGYANAVAGRLYEDHYTYAGEIPWSRYFGARTRTASGKPRPIVEYVVSERITGEWKHSCAVEVPTVGFGWEGHHSELNPAGAAAVPAPALCAALGLVRAGGSWDMMDSEGRLAAVFRRWPANGSQFEGSHVVYLRSDLLEQYLGPSRRTALRLVWGERQLSSNAVERMDEPEIQAVRSREYDSFEAVFG